MVQFDLQGSRGQGAFYLDVHRPQEAFCEDPLPPWLLLVALDLLRPVANPVPRCRTWWTAVVRGRWQEGSSREVRTLLLAERQALRFCQRQDHWGPRRFHRNPHFEPLRQVLVGVGPDSAGVVQSRAAHLREGIPMKRDDCDWNNWNFQVKRSDEKR